MCRNELSWKRRRKSVITTYVNPPCGLSAKRLGPARVSAIACRIPRINAWPFSPLSAVNICLRGCVDAGECLTFSGSVPLRRTLEIKYKQPQMVKINNKKQVETCIGQNSVFDAAKLVTANCKQEGNPLWLMCELRPLFECPIYDFMFSWSSNTVIALWHAFISVAEQVGRASTCPPSPVKAQHVEMPHKPLSSTVSHCTLSPSCAVKTLSRENCPKRCGKSRQTPRDVENSTTAQNTNYECLDWTVNKYRE